MFYRSEQQIPLLLRRLRAPVQAGWPSVESIIFELHRSSKTLAASGHLSSSSEDRDAGVGDSDLKDMIPKGPQRFSRPRFEALVVLGIARRHTCGRLVDRF